LKYSTGFYPDKQNFNDSEKLQQSDKGQKTFKWDVCKENPGIWGKADFVINGFVDHINTTKDTTDYLWHTTRFVSVYKMVKNTN
jgi:hypothetical protein